MNADRQRFFALIDKNGCLPIRRPDLGPCWLWLGTIDSSQGYAIFSVKGKKCSAHTVSFRMAGRKVPKGKQLDHLCRNRACPNPDHLEPVTRKENILRGESFSAVNARKTHCKYGHPLSGDNLMRRRKTSDGMERLCRICMRRLWNADH